MSMFKKIASFEEIALEMERNLTAEEPKVDLDVQEIMNSVAALAERFEAAGRVKEAEALTGLLENLADSDSESQFQKNLLETGTLFSLHDFKETDSKAKATDDGPGGSSDFVDIDSADDGSLGIEDKDASEVEGMLSSFDDEE